MPRYASLALSLSLLTALALSAGCASLTESTQQNVLVQTVLDHREIGGVGCVLSNDVGKWFVTSPSRVTIRKSASPLRVDCKKEGAGLAYERIDSKVNGSLWGNIVLTAGLGYIVDKNTGAGRDYPDTLTIIMHRPEDNDGRAPPAAGVTVY